MPKSKKKKKAEKKSAAELAFIESVKANRKGFTRRPRLIQRLDAGSESNPHKSGIGKWFEFHYMGSAEFEYGALGKALRAMREAPDITKEPIRVKLEDGKIAWYVGIGDPDYLNFAAEMLADQLGPRTMRFKESTYMFEAYNGSNMYTVPDGWWAIDQEVPWLLFRSKEHAKLWLKAL